MQSRRVVKKMPLAVRLALSLMVLTMLTLLNEPASAGSLGSGPDGELHVYVPFDFSVRGKTLNAGEYYISRNGEQFVSINDASGSNIIFVLTHGATLAGGRSTTPKLVFHRYGDKYFLTQAWLSYSSVGRQLPASREEHRLARDYRQMQATLEAGK